MRKRHRGRGPVVVWPAFLESPAAPLEQVVQALDESQHWKAEDILIGQQQQLARIAWWAAQNAPYYRTIGAQARELLEIAQDPERFWAAWRALPILSKAQLRSHGKQIYALGTPRDHEPTSTTVTSGSTGIPVEVRLTRLTRLIWNALAVREHLWQGRDFSRRLGVIRFRHKEERDPRGRNAPSWGFPVASLFPSGPASVIHIGFPIDVLARWVVDFDPHYLLTSPSIAASLIDTLEAVPPSLEEMRFMFEPLDPELETRFADEWQVRSTDIYSANEVGFIASRCRQADNLHVQSESVVVEILDDADQPCAVGETGRVVVSSLHNVATPLIRYDLGDYATVGGPCICGRELPVLQKVRGRVRNLAYTPDGRRFWPVSLNRIRDIKAIRQAQYVQTALNAIELRVVLNRPLRDDEREDAIRKVRTVLGHPYDVTVTPIPAITRGPTGKFEEFRSQLE